MTDCLSEDDDEEHHPVSLFECIAYPGPHHAKGRIFGGNPIYAPLLLRTDPVHGSARGTQTVSSIYHDPSSYGLTGL